VADDSTSEYLVSHGSSGGFGRFVAAGPLACARGTRVVIDGPRGLEVGTVLCPATPGHGQFLPVISGRLLRPADAGDEEELAHLRARGEQLFAECRRLADELRLPLEIVDVELLPGGRLIVQHLGDADATPLADALRSRHGVDVYLEGLRLPPEAPEEEEHGGCGQPGCGRAEGGGCTSCGTGGCSSCGGGKVDLRAYFSHLRSQMEARTPRTPLL
jgi:hypothetical protein